jgi:hypothetical protein
MRVRIRDKGGKGERGETEVNAEKWSQERANDPRPHREGTARLVDSNFSWQEWNP